MSVKEWLNDKSDAREMESNASHLTPLESVGMFIDHTNGVTYPMLADGINADLYDGMACHIEDLEETIAEIDELLHDGDIRWQIDDLFWRTDGLMHVLRDREWGRDAIEEWFGPGW